MANKWKVNTSEVRGKIKARGMTIVDFAEKIGISEVSVRNKLNGTTNFTASEIANGSNVLNESPLIFFTFCDTDNVTISN